MKTDLDMRINYENGRWVADDGVISVTGASLDELDENLHQAVVASGRYPAGSTVRVRMRLSMEAIPLWMRQFNPSPDYFNRALTIQL